MAVFRRFALVLLIAFVARAAIGWTWQDRLLADPDAYAAIAAGLAETGVYGLSDGDGHGVPTAFRPPLYPWLLSFLIGDDAVLNLKAVAIFHAVLGAITAALTWDISRRVFQTMSIERSIGPWLAAAIVVIDPLLVWQSTVVMTETLATFLTIAATWLWCVLAMRPRLECSTKPYGSMGWIAAVASLAAIMGLAYLCRPTFLVWGLLTLPLLWWIGPTCRIRRSAFLMVASLVLVTIVGLWTMRNMAAFGHPIWATTHGGYTLLLANNESFYEHVRSGWLPYFRQPWNPEHFFDRHERRFEGDVETAEFWLEHELNSPVASPPIGWNEVDDDRLTQLAAVATIRRDVPTFLKSCVYRLASLWSPFPNLVEGRTSWQIIAASLFGVSLYLGCFVAIARHRMWFLKKPFWPMWTLVISLSVVHSIYFSNPRMRTPIEPMLAIIAVCSMLPLFETVSRKRNDA